MRILVSGASGLVGTALCPFLAKCGHEVVRLSRSAGPGVVQWSTTRREIDAAALEGVDAVVHLAGTNIAEGRWTARRKDKILGSRVQGTRILVEAIRGMAKPPSAFICASAVGYYGDTGDTEVDEYSPAGHGFLAHVCAEWEKAAAEASRIGLRTVFLRTGVVLTPDGGALAKLLPIFRAGLGGPVGGGRQWMSWISIDDLLGVILRVLSDRAMKGPVNTVAPAPITNAEFSRTLGRVLGRPASIPTPAIALKLAFGQMAQETVLASNRVKPRRLLAGAYQYRHDSLESALRHLLDKPA